MSAAENTTGAGSGGWVQRALGWVERVGNKLPDPAALFVIALALVWIVSALAGGYSFSVPAADGERVLQIQNQLTGVSLSAALAGMVRTFTGFPPLGVVLVAQCLLEIGLNGPKLADDVQP